MPVVSRVLLGASGLFWILLVAGVWFTGETVEAGSAALGGIVLTILPMSLGIGLEVGWQGRKRRAAHRAAPAAAEGAPP